MSKTQRFVLFSTLISVTAFASALAADISKPPAPYAAPECVRPNKHSIDRSRDFAASPSTNIGIDRNSFSRNQGIAVYNKDAQAYNACMLSYIAAADAEIKRLHDEAIANIKQAVDDSNFRIKWIERQIQALADEANSSGSAPMAQVVDPSQYPPPDCKKPPELKSGDHSTERTSRYDVEYRAYRSCVTRYIEGGKAEIRQLSDLAGGSIKEIAQGANTRIANIRETVNQAVTDANRITRSEKEFVAPSDEVILVNPPVGTSLGTESITVTGENIQRSIDTPNGEGDPDAISCRLPQQRVDSRLPGPEICKRNRDWASLRKAGYDISSDGRSTVPLRQGGTNCTKSTAGGNYIGYIGIEVCK